MCLVLECTIRFLAKYTLLMLSQNSVGVYGKQRNNSLRSFTTQATSIITQGNDLRSGSFDDRDTICCFSKDYEINKFPKNTQKPLVFRLSSSHATQLASL